MLIRYDAEFPQNVRRLALESVQLTLVSTASPVGEVSNFVTDHVIALRAFENRVFVACANHCGDDGRFDFAGRSHIAAPEGASLAKAAEGEALRIIDIAPNHYDLSRIENPCLSDFRL